MKQGLLLFAHGARDERWAQPFEAVAARVRARAPEVEVRLSFLEFMTPGLVDAGTMLANFLLRRRLVAVLPGSSTASLPSARAYFAMAS